MRGIYSAILLFPLATAAPAAAQSASEYLITCRDGDAMCKSSHAEFKSDFPKALRGDYQAQRNVAFCLRDGCDGAVAPKPITGCAWRMVIVLSGSKHIDRSDTGNLSRDCGKLDAIEREAAAAQADRLAARIRR